MVPDRCRPAHPCQHAATRTGLPVPLFQRRHGRHPPPAATIVSSMELIVTILVPLPLGFFIRSRMAAFVAYLAVHAFVFTFQTLSLVMEWVNGSTEAFGGPFPSYENGLMFAYGVVNLAIYGVGLGLVYLGARLGQRRRTRAHAVLDA
jgi:hypothetical protein